MRTVRAIALLLLCAAAAAQTPLSVPPPLAPAGNNTNTTAPPPPSPAAAAAKTPWYNTLTFYGAVGVGGAAVVLIAVGLTYCRMHRRPKAVVSGARAYAPRARLMHI